MIQFVIYPLSFLIRSAMGRFVFLILGAIVVLGPSEINFPKIYYFAILTICSIYDLNLILNKSDFQLRRRFLLLTLTTQILLVSAFIGSSFSNLELLTYLRGNIQVIIFLLGIPIALSCGRRMSKQKFEYLLLLFGLISALSVWYYWSQKHGAYIFSNERFALDADYLAFLGYAAALNSNFTNKFYKLTQWLTILLIPILLFLSLSRTNYVFVMWILLLSLLMNKRKIRLLAYSGIFVLIFILSGVLRFVSKSLENNPAINSRFIKVFVHFDLNSYIDNASKTDASLIMRKEQGEEALRIFRAHFFFGRGSLGVGEYIDHSYGALAILGVSGLLIICILLFLIANNFVFGGDRLRLIAIFFSTLIPATFIYNWTSNKGFWLALLCILGLQESQRARKSGALPQNH